MDIAEKSAETKRILFYAEKVFGDLNIAHRWLDCPKARFDDRSPMEMLLDGKFHPVEEMLGQIEYGMFA